MSLFTRIIGLLKPGPKSTEDDEAAREGARIRDEVETTRLSTRSGSAAENYQTGRRPSR